MKITEDFVNLLSPTVRAESMPLNAPNCYPYVPLILEEQISEVQIPLIWMSNELTQLAIAPSLGGRILALRDLRTDTDIIAIPDQLPLRPGGIRGVELPFGIEFLAGVERLDSLAHVDYRIKESGGKDGKIAVFLHSWVGDLSWHGVITLAPHRAGIVVEQRIQNRRWQSLPARSGIKIWCQDASDSFGLSVIDSQNRFIVQESGEFSTMPKSGRLAGHRMDEWRVEILPYSNLSTCIAASSQLSVGLSDSELAIQAHEDIEGAKVFLSVDGQTLESQLTLSPGAPVSFSVTEFSGKIEGVVVRDASKQQILTWPNKRQVETQPWVDFPHEILDQLTLSENFDRQVFRHIPGAEAFGLQNQAFLTKSAEEADDLMERYLAYLADDALGWWLKASLRREHGQEPQDSDIELPNAHYLAPLEPLLKAEAFLNTPQAAGKEPNPLLASIAAQPEIASGVVGTYLQNRLLLGMARLADELLRHQENAIIRLLLAYALLNRPGMEATAAEHVAFAEKEPWLPPFPSRKIEVSAVATLSNRFPQADRLNQLNKLVKSSDANE
ncbi:hypothetical protein CCB80_14145 [Armatimonadetes bacterium Uphvl-Ar1]|nr:hypothetical protein CCB80_14145 [Armatimonadetes bacterium Uphvl-Ar1]